MNKELIEKLLKPPYIFIVFGVILLGVFMMKKNSSGEVQNYEESSSNGLDIFSLMETFGAMNASIEGIVSQNSENIQVLDDKLNSNITQLTDIIRVNDENVKKQVSDIKNSIKPNTTFTTTTVKQNNPSKFVTVGTWGKDSINKTTLSGIAQQAGLSLNALLNLNPQYKKNPDLIRTGDKVRVS